MKSLYRGFYCIEEGKKAMKHENCKKNNKIMKRETK